jgi:phospholipid-transporting ATPase
MLDDRDARRVSNFQTKMEKENAINPTENAVNSIEKPAKDKVISVRNSTLKTYSLHFPPLKAIPQANYIKTTKYSLITFLPYNLYFQFKRFYNFYFLLGALSVFAGFSSISPASMIAPLLVVLAFSAVKEAIEDFNRYRADTLANTTPAIRIVDGKKVNIESMALQPGDLVFIKKGSKFYTDCVLLSSAYDDGTVFIETAELDGETNLKRKVCIESTTSLMTDEQVSKITGTVECDLPNPNLLNFEGVIKTPSPEPLSFSNFVPRGSVLRNTDHCYGLVIYSGLDTKIMKNLKQSALKSSSLEAKLNNLVLWAFVYNAVLLISSIILEWINYQDKKGKEDLNSGLVGYQWYIGFQGNSQSYHVWASFISFFALYTYVIPISLFVTIELVRLGQATFMVWDSKMEYCRQDGNKIPMRVNNSNLNEDLGAIDYIFSDKTGTLTQNSMNMAKWYCEGMIMDEMESKGVFYKNMKKHERKDGQDRMDMFLVGLAVCHGCIPAFDEVKNEIIYESQSPDETALLVGARDNKYILKKRSKQAIEVEVDGEMKKYEVLGQIEFNSTRKRMSVIIKVGDKIRVYTKGADNIMLARLDKNPKVNNPDVVSKADKSLTEFSNIGLRTLVIAHRDLTQAEYDAFNKAFKAAEISLGEREDLMAKASEMVEANLTLLGCTAIEDKLQDRVPETIENLLIAGIKLWLLTGDKQETAINIGLSSRLINKSMKLLILAAADPATCERAMEEMIVEQSSAPAVKFLLILESSFCLGS